jgi:[CysO sulfur-carrier protein]-S-L-cysteine hydrolase
VTSLLDASLARIAALAEADRDREVCGVILADGGEAELVPLRNAAEEPARAFQLAPRDLLAILRRTDQGPQGIRLAALFHSHPAGGAALSAKDLEGLTADGAPLLPGAELWVVGMESGRAVEVRAFRWTEGSYVEVERRRAPFTL